MRVSSLSNERVIDLVSAYIVPVWVSRDSYQLGPRPKEEKAELSRVDRERSARHLDGGAVCVYLLAPDGTLKTTLKVQKASKPEILIPFLEKLIETDRLPPRQPEARRASAAPKRAPRRSEKDGLFLHVLTRFTQHRTNYGVSQDWAELTAEEWRSFVPAADVRAGASWEVPGKVADKLFRYFYPPGPNWRAADSTVLNRSLTATAVTVSDKKVRVSLHGTLELSHPFGIGTEGRVRAKLSGILTYDPGRRVLTSFLMASEEAEFVWQGKGPPHPDKMVIAVEMERAP
ncbi:MAG: hypothetical protein HYS12_04740 [Planctomycetes bacterium]|nr:hypothetical protein [Planctomycetota bacterium]